MKSVQNIGLMMTYNEEDMIEEVMTENRRYFDKVYVLDGSTDKTESILRSFDHVVYLIKDQDLRPKRRVQDGARQFLLEKAQEDCGTEGWFTILHGDEIMVDNPNTIVERAEKSGAEKVNWHSLNFFLHTSQKNQVFSDRQSMQSQLPFYQPGSLEIRQFKNKPGLFYNINRGSCVLPYGIGHRMLWDFPIFKHYVVRSVKQLQSRPLSGFAYQAIDKSDEIVTLQSHEIFKEKLYSDLKQVRKYEGHFEEFEPGNRPPFILQWLNWYRYKGKA